MDAPSTPSKKMVIKTCPDAPWCSRHQPCRVNDNTWSWPKEMIELSKEDLDNMPNDIKKCVYSYLRKSIDWNK